MENLIDPVISSCDNPIAFKTWDAFCFLFDEHAEPVEDPMPFSSNLINRFSPFIPLKEILMLLDILYLSDPLSLQKGISLIIVSIVYS